MIIDATNLVLGRFATKAAKAALLGENVDIVNCENAVITGSKATVFARYKRKRELGIPLKGPYFPRQPDRFVRRIVRGMLPYKKPKGSEAFKRVMCYRGIPDKFKDQKFVTFKEADVSKLTTLKFITVKELCKLLGAK
ncbi:50S ribosomal protein L13 [Candidatus Woesearchaeota archaeon]|nr:50S ribosomal protein L13 [Candidatus Woesearchaeota archaeon]MBW3021306.1 50S ribosomal protein L13 [Candidatus Woesearchaeota archaeon]